MPVINTDAASEGTWGISQLTQTFRIPSVPVSRIAARSLDLLLSRSDCDKGDASLCEKPVASSHYTVGIIVGAAAGLVLVTGSVLTYLHCRRSRRDRRDDEAHAHELADYGMDPMTVKNPRKAAYKPDSAVQPGDVHGLAPPTRRMSSDSLSSLARSIRGRDDPFGSQAEVSRTDSSDRGWKEEEAHRQRNDPFKG